MAPIFELLHLLVAQLKLSETPGTLRSIVSPRVLDTYHLLTTVSFALIDEAVKRLVLVPSPQKKKHFGPTWTK